MTETSVQKRDRRADMLGTILADKGTTPADWVADQVYAEPTGRIPFDDLRGRLARLLPRAERDYEAAALVLTNAIGALGANRVHVAQPGGDAVWVIAGPPPPPRKEPNWTKVTTSDPAPAGNSSTTTTPSRKTADGWNLRAAAQVAEAGRIRDEAKRYRAEGTLERFRAARQ